MRTALQMECAGIAWGGEVTRKEIIRPDLE